MNPMSKRISARILAACLALALTGCSADAPAPSTAASASSASPSTASAPSSSAVSSAKSAPSSSAAKKQEPNKIKMMLCYWDAEPPTGDALIYKTICEKTNVQLDVTWVPPAAMDEKVALSIASLDLPEVMMINNRRLQNIYEAVQSGMFWETGPMLKDFTYLKTIPQSALDAVQYDGKVYGLPRITIRRDGGMVIRRDWLEKLKLPVPETIDQLYETYRAFTFDDPDGNGKQDTYALSVGLTGGLTQTMLAMGMAHTWHVGEDSRILPSHMQDGYVDALRFMKRLYDEGLMNKDFVALDGTSSGNAFMAGKAGLTNGSVGQITTGARFQPLFQSFPDAKLYLLDVFKGPDGKNRCNASPGIFATYTFPKPAVKTEERLREILQFFDDGMAPEIEDLFVKGIEGVHYAQEGGTFKRIDQKLFDKDARGTISLYVSPVIVKTLALGSSALEKEMYALQMREDITDLVDLNQMFTTTTPLSPLNKIMDDAYAKFVMGDLDEAGVKAAMAQWSAQGGDKVIEDFTAQYQKSQAK